MALGRTFSPFTQEGTSSSSNGAASPIQKAITILSLRYPRVLGASAPTSPALLAGTGQAATGRPAPSAVVDNIVRGIVGGGGADQPGRFSVALPETPQRFAPMPAQPVTQMAASPITTGAAPGPSGSLVVADLLRRLGLLLQRGTPPAAPTAGMSMPSSAGSPLLPSFAYDLGHRPAETPQRFTPIESSPPPMDLGQGLNEIQTPGAPVPFERSQALVRLAGELGRRPLGG